MRVTTKSLLNSAQRLQDIVRDDQKVRIRVCLLSLFELLSFDLLENHRSRIISRY